MNSETYLFKSEGNNEILVNDGSSFTQDLFEGANIVLSAYRKILPHPSLIICPSDYEEDALQSEQRTDFHASDWLLMALEVDGDFEPRRALLMNRYRQEEGFVFDFVLERSVVHFFRFFAIQETSGGPILLQKDFLESINLVVETRKENDYRDFDDYDDEEDENYFDYNPYPTREFAPSRKTNIPNLGGVLREEEPFFDEEDEEEEDLHIEPSRPEFTASRKSRPLNLNALDRDEEYEKEKAKAKREAEKEEEQGDFRVDVQKPAFIAAKKGRPQNLNAIEHDEEYQKQKAQGGKRSRAMERAMPPITTTRPAYVPNSNKKPRNLDEKEPLEKKLGEQPNGDNLGSPSVPENSKPVEFAKIFGSEEAEKDAAVLGPKKDRISGVVVENNYKAEPSFNLRPDVRHHEASLINDPDNKYSSASCIALYEKLKEIRTLRISANCLFVPEILPDTHEVFSLAKSFRAEEWDLLALIHDREEKPLCALLGNKKEENLAILISFRHRDPRIMVISAKGIPLNDPAYPFYSYRNLLSIVRGQSPYKIGEN